MQVASPSIPNLPLLPVAAGLTSGGTASPPMPLVIAAPGKTANETAGGDAGAAVTLSAESAQALAADVAPMIYAEIWKGSIKVAQVDAHGGVTSFVGLMPSSSGGGGPLMASLRAAQIAQSVGGEIRVAGQVTSGATLAMRARLQNLYGQ